MNTLPLCCRVLIYELSGCTFESRSSHLYHFVVLFSLVSFCFVWIHDIDMHLTHTIFVVVVVVVVVAVAVVVRSFFFLSGFSSQTLTIHRTAGEGTIFYSTLPLPPAHEH